MCSPNAGPSIAATGPMFLTLFPHFQPTPFPTTDRNQPMISRKLTILFMVVAMPVTSIFAGGEEGWTVLFDGTSTDQWQDYKGGPIGKGWTIEDGALTLSGKPGGDVTTKQTYSDFDFRFEWKISRRGNSGIIFLSRAGDPASYMSGPEFQILDDAKMKNAEKSKTSTGALYALVAAEGKQLNPAGEWNSGRIVKDGKNLQHWVNGKKVVETTIGDAAWDKMVANSKFKQWPQFGKTTKGHLILQDHGKQVWYRNIKIKDLSK